MSILGRHLLGLDGLSADKITAILDTAHRMKQVGERQVKKLPTLHGRIVATLFYEASTRTRLSFELAAKRLSADVLSFAVATSSVTKKESLIDTVRTLEAMGVDTFIVRHPVPGAAHLVARMTNRCVLNGGDGAHEHPTQALLDMLTIREHRGVIAGLKVVIVGDIAHSRVARSNVFGLRTMGAHVTLVGPPTLMPAHIAKLGVSVSHDLDRAIEGADVVMALRLQRERQDAGLLPSIREYVKLYQVTRTRVARAREGCLVMHPGPMNRGVEITPDVADGAQSVIQEQVENGIAVRMALLYLLLAGRGEGKPERDAPLEEAAGAR
jgi:aspartate carbamoyltransferase catalytic subunit